MKYASLIFRQSMKILAAAILALGFLSLFCYVYSFSPISILDPTQATLVKTLPGSPYSNMTEGFAWNRADENGYYNASFALAQDPEILLIGSSHMEALQVPMKESLGGLLNEKYKTYNIAVSGHFFHISVNHLPASVPLYKPSKYVILEAYGLPLSLEVLQDLAADDQISIRTPPIYSRLNPGMARIYKELRTYCPAFLTMFQGLKNWRSAAEGLDKQAPTEVQYTQEYLEAMTAVIQKANNIVSQQGAQLIIFVHDGGRILENGQYEVDENMQMAFDILNTACQKNGVTFLNMNIPFEAFYKQEHILPHGFINTAVGSGHLNSYGHKIIAETLLRTIAELED